MLNMATKPKRTPMSNEHKAALAEGRNQGRSVRRYLEALEAHKPKRGRKRTPESVQKRLVRIEADLVTADPLKRLQLIQERLDLQAELDAAGTKVADGQTGAVELKVPEGIYTVVIHGEKPITIPNVQIANKRSTKVALKKEGQELGIQVHGPK